MSYRDTTRRLAALRGEIARLRDDMRKTQSAVEPEPVENYGFATTDGASCRFCTLWADGFNGVLAHLESRAAFVVSSPDAPEKQQKFKDLRGWKFRMVSHRGSNFARDMGYMDDNGYRPGVSVFKKKAGAIVRVSDQQLGPYDDFCAVWHFFDMLPEGASDWAPQYKYGGE
jgi:predicted dithiol-disulfide oxidoreductase (DUF899 family)